MTKTTNTYLVLGLCLAALLFACRPPMKCIDNKSVYFKSTRTKNSKTTLGKINTTGTFLTLDTTCNRPCYTMIKFNSDQTVQVSKTRDNITKPLIISNDSYLQYLDNNVSYYYFIDKNAQTLTLERFEYWDAPWWNFFVQTDHYLVETFTLKGDTLINHVTDRFSRFGRQYILDKKLIDNFDHIDNDFQNRRRSSFN